ncbi:hypothetical protein [Deinococcus xianganensis]|uniref:Uncharacterized protein n=1 Tax=Deinococcus xianganensis TaxID=1507289 RepID=A0A6I4YTU2_9DEIO|nr:hypothetical protein [Deinococcus xianganensis]MXV21055.1 hypothetical protein [Deinococcus xianganensis]
MLLPLGSFALFYAIEARVLKIEIEKMVSRAMAFDGLSSGPFQLGMALLVPRLMDD